MEILNLIGNLGADAKLVENNGRPFVSFNVANTERWVDENGETHEKTDWVSCALNGKNEKLLPYLKAGVKVFAMGRVRTRVYSSEKERRMVAGLNLSVIHVELVGGSADEVPRRLFTNEGVMVSVNKAYYVPVEIAQKTPELYSQRGDIFHVQPEGWVTPAIPATGAIEAAEGQQADAADTNQESGNELPY